MKQSSWHKQTPKCSLKHFIQHGKSLRGEKKEKKKAISAMLVHSLYKTFSFILQSLI